MQLRAFFITSSGDAAFVAMADSVRYVAHVFYGKDEGRRVIMQSSLDDEAAGVVLNDIDTSPMDQVAKTRSRTFEGGSIELLIEVARVMAHLVGQGKAMRAEMRNAAGHIYHLSVSKNAGLKDAMLAYCDPHGGHHLLVFNSKSQGRAYLSKEMRWLDAATFASASGFVEQGDLEEQVTHGGTVDLTREMVHFTGDIAAYFNTAFLVRKESASAPIN